MPWLERPDVEPWEFRKAQDKAASIFLALVLLGAGVCIGFGWLVF